MYCCDIIGPIPHSQADSVRLMKRLPFSLFGASVNILLYRSLSARPEQTVTFHAAGALVSNRHESQHRGPSKSEDEHEEEDPVRDFIENNDFGKKFYNQNGTMGELFGEMDRKDEEVQTAAKKWVEGTYEAFKGARRKMVHATNTAQNVLATDGLKVRAAVNSKFGEEMGKAKIDQDMVNDAAERTGTLTPKWRGVQVRISEWYGARQGQEIEGSVNYRGLSGEVTNYNSKMATWTVQPDKEGLAPVTLHIGDFEMEDDEDEKSVPGRHRYRLDDKTEAMLGSLRRKAMMRYKGDHQHVHIDSLPNDVQPAIRDVFNESSSHVGRVVNYSPVKEKFQIQPIKDDGVPETNDHLWPWLEEGVNFHRMKDLEGLEVMIRKPMWKGEVEDWVPGPHGGKYNVKVLGAPDQTVSLSRHMVDRGRQQYWRKIDHENGDMTDLVDDQLLLTLQDGSKVRGVLTAYNNDALHGFKKFNVQGVQIQKDGTKGSPNNLVVDQNDVRELQVLQKKQRDDDSESGDATVPEVN